MNSLMVTFMKLLTESGVSEALAQWLYDSLSTCYDLFVNGKASLHSVEEDGLPMDVVSSSKGKVQGLLKPKKEMFSWRWSGIFTKAQIEEDELFDNLFDRRIFSALVNFSCSLAHFENCYVNFRPQKESIAEKEVNSVVDVEMEKEGGDMRFIYNHSNAEFKEKFKALTCNIFSIPPTSEFLKSEGKQLLRSISENEEEYYRLRDESKYRLSMHHFELMQRSSRGFKRSLSYERLFFLVRTLNKLWVNYVQCRPSYWQNYLVQRPEQVHTLFSSLFHLNDESAILCLGLLATAFSRQNVKDMLTAETLTDTPVETAPSSAVSSSNTQQISQVN